MKCLVMSLYLQDKTFGLKNKKGAKQQKFIQTVQVQVNQQGKTAKQVIYLNIFYGQDCFICSIILVVVVVDVEFKFVIFFEYSI